MDFTISVAMAIGGLRLSQDIPIVAEQFVRSEFTVANGQTAFHANLAVDISQMKAILILSDKAVTIKTNSSGSPDDTVVLAANVPYLWYAGPTIDASDENPFDADITDLYIANASGATATVKIWVATDGTP
jgi:hypothetical protein